MTSDRPDSLSDELRSKPRDALKIWGPGVAVVVLGFVTASLFIKPAPPERVVIATGGRDGAYWAFAHRYARYLAQRGITLEVRETAGSVENYRLLAEPGGEVTVALLQGGTVPEPPPAGLESLASLYLEPVFVFHRGEERFERLGELAGRRVAVGPEGSGTRAVALELLADNGLRPGEGIEISKLGGGEAAAALREGALDAVFFVLSPRSPLVRELLAADGVQLMSFARALAYTRRHRYLSEVLLPEGAVDLERNLPAEGVVLLAPAANLVAREDIHSAIVLLLLEAARREHERGDVLSEAGQFPSLGHVELPVNTAAERYFRHGPSLLYRWLPFSLASLIDRMWILVLPLLTLLVPLSKMAPPVYRWRIRSRIYRWYRVLRAVDQRLMGEGGGPVDVEMEEARLDLLEKELLDVWVPWSYMDEFYNLRLHIQYIRRQLESRREAG